MSLIPRNTFPSLGYFFDDDDFSRFFPEAKSAKMHVAVDIRENDKEYTVKADFPGIKKDDIDITIDNNLLTISAEYKDESQQKEGGKVVRQERRYGKYSRSFTLGDDVDEESVKAKLDDGVLTLIIPKSKQQKVDSRKITIN